MSAPATAPVGAVVTLRPGRPEDADACGEICYRAFRSIGEQHGFPTAFPSAHVARALIAGYLRHPDFYSVVAELDGLVVGSNFLDGRSAIAGIGPVTVDPAAQAAGIGRRLMLAGLAYARGKSFAGVRLVQSAYNAHSLGLYATLGFEVREPLLAVRGAPPACAVAGRAVRSATTADLGACDRVSERVLGYARSGELLDAIHQDAARVVEHPGRVTGYTTGLAFFGHSVGESNADIMALIGATGRVDGPGFLLPARNTELLRWCLDQRMRVVQPMTLMSVGAYVEPAGAYLPSVVY